MSINTKSYFTGSDNCCVISTALVLFVDNIISIKAIESTFKTKQKTKNSKDRYPLKENCGANITADTPDI